MFLLRNLLKAAAPAVLLIAGVPHGAMAAGIPTEQGVKIAQEAAAKCGETLTVEGLAEAVEKGTQVALENEEYDTGYGDSESIMKMVLYSRQGESAERELRQMQLENESLDMGDKSLIVFDHPADVAGTSMLTFAKILEQDDQWLFLPAFKRVKRISSNNKSGSFLGSEFAFEDFSGQEFGKYAYRYLREEACPGAEDLTCHVSERYPLYEGTGYTKQIAWTDVEGHRPYKVEYYNRGCEKLKTLMMSDHRQYLDRYWRAHKLHMENHLTGKSTDLIWEKIDFRVGLTDSDFTQNSLKRAR